MTPRETGSSALVAALPFAAAASLWFTRVLPVRFEYEPNTLGIVSVATELRYPQQQETFWLFAAALCGVAVSWALARAIAARRADGAATEAAGVLALLAALWLPAVAAFIVGIGCLAFALRPAPQPLAATAAAAPPWRGPGGITLSLSLLLALLVTGDFWANAISVAQGFRDDQRAIDGFPFMGEIGQHLAWANALANDRFHGKDFFCLYGPLYDLGLVGAWELFGRSIVAWDLYFSATRVVAMTGLLFATASLLRHRLLFPLVLALAPWISLRSGLAVIGLCFVFDWLRTRHTRSAAIAGVVAGASLLFSQEFGLAYCVVTALAFALHTAWRPALVFAAGATAIVLPVFAWYAAHDALLPMLREIVGYPAYVVAGYAKLPFPPLFEVLPLVPASFPARELLPHRIGYAVPAICIAGGLLAMGIHRFDLRAPLASVRAMLAGLRADPMRSGVLLVALFGMMAFRTALGRSDVKHLIDPVPAAALLLVVALDRVLCAWQSGAAEGRHTAWRVAAVLLLVVHGGFAAVATPLRDARDTVVQTTALLERGRRPIGNANVMQVTRWLQLETEVDEPILFLPNNGAYYYLTNRPSPIRFVMGHQIVTEAHRQEVLAALQARPPRYFVWDAGAARIDDLSDEKVFGSALLDWLDANYAEVERFGAVSVRRHREASAGTAR